MSEWIQLKPIQLSKSKSKSKEIDQFSFRFDPFGANRSIF